jgi:hypothetical protein
MMRYAERFLEAFKASVSTKRKMAAVTSIALLTFLLMALSSNIEYSYQMISAGLWQTAIENRIADMQFNSGNLGLVLTSIYSALAGIAIVNFHTQFKNGGANFKGLTGILPGFLVAGCASCGVGVLALLGFAGALTALPFQGNLVRLGASLLLVYYLLESGDPRKCEI